MTNNHHESLSVPLSSSSSSSPPTKPQHLILIGGGHAHVQVITALTAQARPSQLHVTLIDGQASASYSGMVPGAIAHLYTPDETLLHLEPLAVASGITFVHDRVVDMDLTHKRVRTAQGDELDFDAVSIDIGSTSRAWKEIPGAREYTIPTRPIHKLVERLNQARDDMVVAAAQRKPLQSTEDRPRLVVVGGGAAGVELSMAITSKWHADGLQPHPTVLLDAGSELLPHEQSVHSRQTLYQLLDQRNIQVQHNAHVTAVSQHLLEVEFQPKDHNTPENGGTTSTTATTSRTKRRSTIPFTHCVWATGAGAHDLAFQLHEHQGLEVTEHGWIQVQDTLQSTSHPFVFAAGDCASIQVGNGKSPPKAGVYAVRAGPILIQNLTRYLQQQQLQREQKETEQQQQQQQQLPKSTSPTATTSVTEELEEQEDLTLVSYQPQDDFLKLLVCGPGQAVGFRFGIPLYGKWVLQMKDRIDQNFMNLFRVKTDSTTSKSQSLPETKPNKSSAFPKYNTAQYDQDDVEHISTTTKTNGACDNGTNACDTCSGPSPTTTSSSSSWPLAPAQAAQLIARHDDEVDFLLAWSVLRAMAQSDDYRDQVVQHFDHYFTLPPSLVETAAAATAHPQEVAHEEQDNEEATLEEAALPEQQQQQQQQEQPEKELALA